MSDLVYESRLLGEKLGLLREAEARLAEWPTLADDKLVEAARKYDKARSELSDQRKAFKRAVLDN